MVARDPAEHSQPSVLCSVPLFAGRSYWAGGEAGMETGEQRLTLVKVSEEVEVRGSNV